jgi:hypothetical protein
MDNGKNVPRLPGAKHRLAIIGRTGSGKTVAALWHLSQRNIDAVPWIIVDFKGDENINSIENAQHVGMDIELSAKSKGLYIVHPLPGDEEHLEHLLWKIWERGNTGLYVDEAYMVDKSKGFQAILTQGRSKRIPVIALAQRPVWCSRFMFSEADFIQVFNLNDKRDKQTVESFMPVDLDEPMDDYNSRYYDIGKNKLWRFEPVPNVDKILGEIDAKLVSNRKHIFV